MYTGGTRSRRRGRHAAGDSGKTAGGKVQVTAKKRQAPGPTHSWRCRKDGGRRRRNTAAADAETAAVRLSESM